MDKISVEKSNDIFGEFTKNFKIRLSGEKNSIYLFIKTFKLGLKKSIDQKRSILA